MLHKNGSSHRRCSVKEGVLRNFAKFTGIHRKASLAQVFFCEFCEISKNTFLTEHLRTAASVKNLFRRTSKIS